MENNSTTNTMDYFLLICGLALGFYLLWQSNEYAQKVFLICDKEGKIKEAELVLEVFKSFNTSINTWVAAAVAAFFAKKTVDYLISRNR